MLLFSARSFNLLTCLTKQTFNHTNTHTHTDSMSQPQDYGPTWPDFVQAKMIVLDFDKTITMKHTRGKLKERGLEDEEARCGMLRGGEYGEKYTQSEHD